MINKKIIAAALGLAVALGLSACGKQLTTTKTTYRATGMVAVVKGDAKGYDQVHYQGPTASGSAKVNADKFVFTVPMSTKTQTITLKAGGQTKQVKVQKASALGDYQKFAKTFNQGVVAAALPPSVQQQLQKGAQANPGAAASLPPAQQAAMVKQQQALQAEMTKAQEATRQQQLPAKASGLKQVLDTAGGQVRVNVQDGQLMGVTDVVAVKALKTKSSKAAFGQQFGMLVNATGANAKKVGDAFTKRIKDADKGSTTIETIRDHGVKFDLGLSADHLYIYITK